MIVTAQCSICLDAPSYQKCAGTSGDTTCAKIVQLEAKLAAYELAERELPEYPQVIALGGGVNMVHEVVDRGQYDALRAYAVAMTAENEHIKKVDFPANVNFVTKTLRDRAEKAEAALAEMEHAKQVYQDQMEAIEEKSATARSQALEEAAKHVDTMAELESAGRRGLIRCISSSIRALKNKEQS